MYTVSHNESNYYYHFIIKRLSKKLENNLLFLRKYWKLHNLYIQFQQKKELQKFIKAEKKLRKIYLTYCSLLIVQNLWQVLYQILSIIFPNKFTEFNVKTDITIRNVKLAELNISITTFFLNTRILKII